MYLYLYHLRNNGTKVIIVGSKNLQTISYPDLSQGENMCFTQLLWKSFMDFKAGVLTFHYFLTLSYRGEIH